jgi:mannan endo-1,4-beta-mannosidase
MSDVTPLVAETGQNPAILGVVMNYVGNSGAYDIGVANTIANQWWAQGGLVELSIYSDDPTFSDDPSGYPNGTSIPASAFHELTDTSSAAYKQWHSQLDTYATELHTLTDSGNVVMLRPFIELNGDWNWYGAQAPSDFIFVWQDMYDYLMKAKGLINVLWIYNVNANVGRYSDYYPGSSYVDVVGMDIYDSPGNYVADANNGGMYAFLVSTGKPLILPEVGLSSSTPGTDSIDNSQLMSLIQPRFRSRREVGLA